MTGATDVNTSAPPRAVMWSIGEIAERDGVSKPAVSRKVAQLVERNGLSVERDERGRVAKVNVAEYDHLRGRFDDPSKAQRPQAPIQAPSITPAGESYDEALRQKTWTEAERARLRLEEEKGDLIRRGDHAAACSRFGEVLIRIVKSLVNCADDHAVVVARDGANGLRKAYKELTDRQLNEMADALVQLAALSSAPEREIEEAGEEPAPQVQS